MSSSSDEEIVPIEVPDDEVFRRKLLMDGEGMGDSRRIDSLMKEVFIWHETEDQTDEQITEGHEKLLSMLASVELSARKSAEAQQANERQIKEYDAAYADIESKIVNVKETIANKKDELVEAKKVRKNKLKYHALANIIADLPDRKQTQDRLETLGCEIEELDSRNHALESRMEQRGKKLGLVLNATEELKIELKSEEKEDWDNSDSEE